MICEIRSVIYEMSPSIFHVVKPNFDILFKYWNSTSILRNAIGVVYKSLEKIDS